MAESFAFTMADKLLGKATSVVADQVRLVGSVYTELESLKDTISTVKAVLLDAEEQQHNNHQLTDWLRKLKDCFYDAEDVLDEFDYHSLQQQVVSELGGFKRRVSHFFSTSSNPLAFRFKMGRKIKEIRERLDKIAADADKFNLNKIIMGAVPASVPVPVPRREMTYSYVRASDVIGRDDDKENIIQLLMMMQSSKENVSVLPIVGIGGLGKTTLAKLVYNDERVAKHFDKRAWVCASDEFDVTRLIKEIITCVTNKKCDELPIDVLLRSLRNELADKKLLLILDDVWNTNGEKWVELKELVEVGDGGSTVIVTTTRDKSVAEVMGTYPAYELKGLSDEECLSLFIRCVFKDGEDKRYPNLVGIGKDIVKKCKGLPLAVRTLRGLLQLKREESDWEKVRDSQIWQLEQKESGILPALKLSYNGLSFDVKQCFASCSLFPKDFEFNSIQLTRMWMGQGLIQPSEQKAMAEEMEDTGNRTIDELLQISFFQDVDDFDGLKYARSFKMHDLVHDLALLVARPECRLLNFDSGHEITSTKVQVRHISMLEAEWPEEEEKVSRFFGKLNNNMIRTISFPNMEVGPRSEAFMHTNCILRRLKFIRVLDLIHSSFESLPHSICNLKLLRYLDLSDNHKIKRLPDSICKLHLLQTLLLQGCNSLEELPRHIGKMMSLSYLSLTTVQQKGLITMPHNYKEREREAVGRRSSCFFNSLRILFVVGCNSLESLLAGGMPMMGSFTALRTLIIGSCPRVTSLPKHLPALENLIIVSCKSLDLGNMNRRNGEREDEDNIRAYAFGSLRVLIIFMFTKVGEVAQVATYF